MINSCSKDMNRALQLLFNTSLTASVLFNQFAFIGDNFLLGTALDKYITNWEAIENDNISSPSGSFICLDLCNLIKVSSSSVQYTVPIDTSNPDEISAYNLPNMNIEYASLENISAIVFNFSGSNADFKTALTQLINTPASQCMILPMVPPAASPCKDSIYTILNKTVNITAGNLALYQAQVLGKIGDVLCLANTAPNVNRIYFVCLNSISFIGFTN